MHDVGPQPNSRPSSLRKPMCSGMLFWASVREVRSRGETVSKGSNSECGAVGPSGLVEAVDINRAEVRDNMEDGRAADEEMIDERFNGEALTEENNRTGAGAVTNGTLCLSPRAIAPDREVRRSTREASISTGNSSQENIKASLTTIARSEEVYPRAARQLLLEVFSRQSRICRSRIQGLGANPTSNREAQAQSVA